VLNAAFKLHEIKIDQAVSKWSIECAEAEHYRRIREEKRLEEERKIAKKKKINDRAGWKF
jgi:hypothetical protein